MTILSEILDASQIDQDVKTVIKEKLSIGGVNLLKPPRPALLNAAGDSLALFGLNPAEVLQLQGVLRSLSRGRPGQDVGDGLVQGSEKEKEGEDEVGEQEDDSDEANERRLKRRRVDIEEFFGSPSTSTTAKMSAAEEKCGGAPIKNGRFCAQQAPMVLYNDILGTFRQRSRNCKPTADDVRAVQELCRNVGQRYLTDEVKEYSPVAKVMRPYLGRVHPITGVSHAWTQIVSCDGGKEMSDGGVLGPGGSVLLTAESKPHTVEKHEVQNIRCFDHYCTNILDGSLPIFDISYMPCLAVTFAGSIMRVGGLVRGEVAIYEIFETVDLLDLWRLQPGTMHRAACIMKTMYDILHLLHDYYSKLLMTPPPCNMRISLLDREVPVPLHDTRRFVKVRQLQKEGNPCLFTYCHPGTDEKCVAKIVRGSLHGEVHATWSQAGHAPRLLGNPEVVAEDLDGPLVLLCMEYLPRDRWLHPQELADQEKPAALKAAQRALALVHGLPLPGGGTAVHGDLRCPNVLLSKDPGGEWLVKFIDLDWSGKLGDAVYPELPNPDLQWPDGADWNQPITKEHDLWQLEHAFMGLEDRQKMTASVSRSRLKRPASGSPGIVTAGVTTRLAARKSQGVNEPSRLQKSSIP